MFFSTSSDKLSGITYYENYSFKFNENYIKHHNMQDITNMRQNVSYGWNKINAVDGPIVSIANNDANFDYIEYGGFMQHLSKLMSAKYVKNGKTKIRCYNYFDYNLRIIVDGTVEAKSYMDNFIERTKETILHEFDNIHTHDPNCEMKDFMINITVVYSRYQYKTYEEIMKDRENERNVEERLRDIESKYTELLKVVKKIK